MRSACSTLFNSTQRRCRRFPSRYTFESGGSAHQRSLHSWRSSWLRFHFTRLSPRGTVPAPLAPHRRCAAQHPCWCKPTPSFGSLTTTRSTPTRHQARGSHGSRPELHSASFVGDGCRGASSPQSGSMLVFQSGSRSLTRRSSCWREPCPPTHIHFCMHARTARVLSEFRVFRAYTCKPEL